ncbi:MAG: PASTA domain-containing protein [Bacillota bacterium]|nr:PASTA domain-containing protein [Bacillota bacterium]
MKAIQKDQNNRYQTATNMLKDLNMVLRDPTSEPTFKVDIDNSPTRRIQVVNPEILKPAEIETKEIQKEENDDMKSKKKDKLTWILAIATSMLIISIFVFFAFKFIVPTITPPAKAEIKLENYVGRDINEVKQELEKQGITVNVEPKSDKNVEKDKIISQKPKEGESIKPDPYNPVTLYVSSGPEMIKIPDVSKYSLREAQQKLNDLNLTTSTQDEYSDVIASGLVIRTEPGVDEEVSPGSSVTIYRSKGPEIHQTVVPNLIGLTRVDAQKSLTNANLTLGKVLPEDSGNNVDKIVSQDPAPNTTVTQMSAVNITLETAKTNPQATPSNNQGGSQATPNGNQNNATKTKDVPVKVPLSNAEAFGDTMKVLIEMTPSDTQKSTIIMDGTVNKSDFPLNLTVPVPENGRTNIKVYVDSKPNSDMTIEYPGGR